MALKFSTGFKNKLLDTGSLKSLMDDGYLIIYSGTEPASPDDAIGAVTKIVQYSDAGAAEGAGNGLDLELNATNGVIGKDSVQVWQGDALATTNGAWFRFYPATYTTGASTTEARIQGTVGGAGADLFVSSTSFNSGSTYSIDLFSIAIPDL